MIGLLQNIVGEECDTGGDTIGCTSCKLGAGYTCTQDSCEKCGDGYIQGNEECDIVANYCVNCVLAQDYICHKEEIVMLGMKFY